MKLNGDGFLQPGKILAWICLYLVVAWSLPTISAILESANAVFRNELFTRLLFISYIVLPLVLAGVGIVSLLPLSEYAYMREGGINPPIARESLSHQKRGPEKKEFGILLGIVGLTTVVGMNPGLALFFFIAPLIGVLASAVLMVSLFILIVTLYMKKLRQNIQFDTQLKEH
jgi:hypothetical protein